MKVANIPNTVELPTSIIKSQKLSCTGGHRYFVRTRCTITDSVIVEPVDAILRLGGGLSVEDYEDRVVSRVSKINTEVFTML